MNKKHYFGLLLALVAINMMAAMPTQAKCPSNDVDFCSEYKQAKQGDANAQYNLGEMYAEGRGVAQDNKTALRWYKRAAKRGHGGAQMHLKMMADAKRQDIVQDYRMEFRRIIEQGYNSYRYRSVSAKGTDLIIKQAISTSHLNNVAAGNVETEVYMSLAGKDIAQSYEIGFHWFASEVAKPGNVEAQSVSGKMYYKGPGTTEDYKTAIKWFKLAAKQGIALAQVALGRIYAEGLGVAQDYQTAVKWYTKAAEQGDANAQYDLGEIYAAEGLGDIRYTKERSDIQNDKMSSRWYRRAAEQGHVGAQYNLGEMYSEGRGVTQNYVQAHKWLNLAASNGHETAAKTSAEVAKKMTHEQVVKAQKLATEFQPKSNH